MLLPGGRTVRAGGTCSTSRALTCYHWTPWYNGRGNRASTDTGYSRPVERDWFESGCALGSFRASCSTSSVTTTARQGVAKDLLNFDLAQFRKGLLRLGKGYEAIRETIRVQGMGETLNSRRKKDELDSKKPRHGREISWLFRTKAGVDVFAQTGADFDAILDMMTREMMKAVTDAFRTERQQANDMKRLLLKAAQLWAEAVQDRIEAGYLGQNTKANRERKSALIKYAGLTAEYGNPAHRGIRSGRWLRGIRGRWRQGRVRDAG